MQSVPLIYLVYSVAMITHVFQVGPGVVFLLIEHSFLGRGVILQCVTPVEPLLQFVTHTIFYQSNIPPLVPKFILKAESIQVQHTLTSNYECYIVGDVLYAAIL